MVVHVHGRAAATVALALALIVANELPYRCRALPSSRHKKPMTSSASTPAFLVTVPGLPAGRRARVSSSSTTAALPTTTSVAHSKASSGRSEGGRRHAPAMTVSAEATQRQHEESVDEVVARLDNPTNAVVNAFKDSLRLFRDIEACDDPQLKEALTTAMQVLRDGLRLYGPSRLVGSYNGGKDAVVIMHLQRAAVADYSVQRGKIFRSKYIYFENDREFPEVEQLVSDHEEQYNLDLHRSGLGFVKGLEQHMKVQGGGQDDLAFGFVLGTRKGDPNCGVQHSFSPSSDWMPAFMRVNPILNWDYGQVWAFLRKFNLPYCTLYDQGYTSLGNLDNTAPNPSLRRPPLDEADTGSDSDGNSEDGKAGGENRGEPEYLPAFMLSDWSMERAGRGARKLDSLACELKSLDEQRRKVREAGTAGLVVIGDEILKGKCVDCNTSFATKRLWEKGIFVKRVAVVSDDQDAIAEEVRRQVQAFDLVITSGGVGPTHDDITIYAVAEALNQGVRQNEDMLEKLAVNFNLDSTADLTEPQRKMAMLPELAKLRVAPVDHSNWPILQCENVFILPGVPQFFQSKMQDISDHFLDARPMHVRKIVLSADELLVVDSLNEAVSAHPNVQFGSYPYIENPAFKTVVTLESEEEADVDAAVDALLVALPEEYVIKVVSDNNLK